MVRATITVLQASETDHRSTNRALGLIQKLQLMQNTIVRLLMGIDCHQHIILVLKGLHWLPICYLTRFKVLVLMYKTPNSLGPGGLKDRLIPYSPAQSLRSLGELQLMNWQTFQVFIMLWLILTD